TTISSEWLKEDCIGRHEKSKKHEKVLNTKDLSQLKKVLCIKWVAIKR
ncbi:1316_t:CDS:1, partial [Funneliformis geosporum]